MKTPIRPIPAIVGLARLGLGALLCSLLGGCGREAAPAVDSPPADAVKATANLPQPKAAPVVDPPPLPGKQTASPLRFSPRKDLPGELRGMVFEPPPPDPDYDPGPPESSRMEELEGEDFIDRYFPPPLSPQVALDILARTRDFNTEAVGAGADAPIEIHAFNVLLDQPNARELLTALRKRALTAGRLYYLCGIQVVEPKAFETEAARLEVRGKAVMYFSGCSRQTLRGLQVVHFIRDQKLGERFRAARQRAEESFRRQPRPEPPRAKDDDPFAGREP